MLVAKWTQVSLTPRQPRGLVLVNGYATSSAAQDQANALVARLDRPRLLVGRVVEVRLDRRGLAAETVGDLPDQEAFELAVMPRQGDRTRAVLEDPTRLRG